ncbi:MAG: hypothetical protein WCC60_21960, partial [Ilumatobacteraceae bacterium]
GYFSAMQSKTATVEEYLAGLDDDRRATVAAVRWGVNAHLPAGYEEGIQYSMIGWFVPHALYPAGYHTDSKQPALAVWRSFVRFSGGRGARHRRRVRG